MTLRSLTRLAIVGAMIVVGVLLAVTVAYRLRGSLEWFPTAEQEAKVRVVTTLLAAGLAITEVGLWQLLRRTHGSRRFARDSARPGA